MENIEKLIADATNELEKLEVPKKGWFKRYEKNEIDTVANKIKSIFHKIKQDILNINKDIPDINRELQRPVGTRNLKAALYYVLDSYKRYFEGKLQNDPDMIVPNCINRIKAMYTPEIEKRYNDACDEFDKSNNEITDVQVIAVTTEQKKIEDIFERISKIKSNARGNISKTDYEESIKSLKEALEIIKTLLGEITKKNDEIKQKKQKKDETAKKHRKILNMRPKLSEQEKSLLEKLIKLYETKESYHSHEGSNEKDTPQNQLECKRYIEELLIQLIKDITKFKEKIKFQVPYPIELLHNFTIEDLVDYSKLKGKIFAILAIITEFTGAYHEDSEKEIIDTSNPKIIEEKEFLKEIKTVFFEDWKINDIFGLGVFQTTTTVAYELEKVFFRELISIFNEAYQYFLTKRYVFYNESDRIDYFGKERAIMTKERDAMLRNSRYNAMPKEYYALCYKYLGLIPNENMSREDGYISPKRHYYPDGRGNWYIALNAAPSYWWDQYKNRRQLENVNFDTINELIYKACYEMSKLENIAMYNSFFVKDYSPSDIDFIKSDGISKAKPHNR